MKYWIIGGALALAACGESAPPVRSAGYVPVPAGASASAPLPPGMATTVSGQPAARLIAQFGAPYLDISEGSARKLQFAGPICVLDAYLYPKGRGEPLVTWFDTRQRDGSPIDPASCVTALTKRR
ncbi:MAG: hypothetical protein KF730_16920 [Sphingomonas sp.]|uniref:hypothetical protein n=1 Tax=Sphingomonas sp. TaxID=28214 RepID=UPI0025FD45FC|nr:hypothetical protein [Sphingomonas sp.]MBX3566245.1 hypothetical protein [Sphingomonas sp.]